MERISERGLNLVSYMKLKSLHQYYKHKELSLVLPLKKINLNPRALFFTERQQIFQRLDFFAILMRAGDGVGMKNERS